MRHGMKGRRLNRPTDERKALLRSLMGSLLRYEKIITTEARAKELRRHVEKLITTARRGDVHSRRLCLATLPDPPAVDKLFNLVAPRFKERPGGYTRLTRVGTRKGDGATMMQIEFVEGPAETAATA
ncbi:MAG TPA: 50S ribosomal protein L17 [Chloroflexota bacterium]|nr:50S ribosomal protein L17 [Chloroflexota bacterium]